MSRTYRSLKKTSSPPEPPNMYIFRPAVVAQWSPLGSGARPEADSKDQRLEASQRNKD
jgi:hypothetical protein